MLTPTTKANIAKILANLPADATALLADLTEEELIALRTLAAWSVA